MVMINRNILTVSIMENPYIHENKINIISQTQKEQDMSSNIPIPDVKYKTELCRTWIEQNFCPYMEKCRFAHGKTDLHDKIIFGKNYKQKDCKSFHTKGYCPYGPRCLFRHDERKFSELNRPFYKFILENNYVDNIFKNLQKKKITEENIINEYDLSEILGYSKLHENEFNVFPNAKNYYYSPHLNIFKKLRQSDSFSFDSTDVEIDLENSEFLNTTANTFSNLNQSPKTNKNVFNSKKKNTNHFNFMNLEKSADNNNYNYQPNCQKNFPILNANNGNLKNNNNLINTMAINYNTNAHITNNNINNFIINTGSNANFGKNISPIKSENNNKNVEIINDLYFSNRNGNDMEYINNDNMVNFQNSSLKNFMTMCVNPSLKNNNKIMNINNSNNYVNQNTEKNLNKIKINSNGNKNLEYASDLIHNNYSNNLNSSIIRIDNNDVFKDENNSNTFYFDKSKQMYFPDSKMNDNKNFKDNPVELQKNADINKEIIFENFSKITKNNLYKKSQKNITNADKKDDILSENPKQSSFSCNNLDELMKIPSSITEKNIKFTEKKNFTNYKNKVFNNNDIEKMNLFNNNSGNINFYSIY